MSEEKLTYIVASDVQRDGIGVEIYIDGKIIAEVFRADTDKTRTVTLLEKQISLELLERSIAIFRKEIPWDFIDYDALWPEDEKK